VGVHLPHRLKHLRLFSKQPTTNHQPTLSIQIAIQQDQETPPHRFKRTPKRAHLPHLRRAFRCNHRRLGVRIHAQRVWQTGPPRTVIPTCVERASACNGVPATSTVPEPTTEPSFLPKVGRWRVPMPVSATLCLHATFTHLDQSPFKPIVRNRIRCAI
jgi:hypothetical protein